MKFPPSISICDIPERLASHVNNYVPCFFSPHEDRLFPITESNLAAAEQGVLKKNLVWDTQWRCTLLSVRWFTDRKPWGRGIRIGASNNESTFRFHETNSSQRRALLRWVTLVPELNGIANIEAEEQLHNIIGRSNYCLNTMTPVNHLFIMRLKIQLHNTGINSAFREKIESTFTAQAGRAV